MSHKLKTKRLTIVVTLLILLAALASFSLDSQQFTMLGSADSQNGGIQPFTHVFYIMMENHGSANIVGNQNAPFINQLIASYGYDNNYFGVTHVSLPNYVAAISGNNWYSYSDDPTQSFNHTNLVDQLVAHNISWKAYMESMPYAGFQGYWYPDNLPSSTSPSVTPPNALYAKKHDPFLLFTDISNNPALSSNVVPLTQLQTDLANGNVPQFVWISPNVCNDMHGQPSGQGTTCPFSNDAQLIQDGDNFLKQWVTAIMSSKAWTGNSVIFINWDEAEYPSSSTTQQIAAFTAPGPDAPILPAVTVDGITWSGGPFGGGQVPLIVIARLGPHPITVSTYADHYNVLRTIEASWHLGYLGMASDGAQVQTLTGFFTRGNGNEGLANGLQLTSAQSTYLELEKYRV